MGALPKRKLSKARRGERRSHHHLQVIQPVRCSNCRDWKLPHHACPSCGFYNGRQVLKIKSEKATA